MITYIYLADEKKLEALSTLLLDKDEEAEYKWWDDEVFIAKLEADSR